MFTSIAHCMVAPQIVSGEDGLKRYEGKPIHTIAFAVDTLLGIALLIIGICATQWEFLPVSGQYALIGVGATYLGTMIFHALTSVKFCVAPEKYLFE